MSTIKEEKIQLEIFNCTAENKNSYAATSNLMVPAAVHNIVPGVHFKNQIVFALSRVSLSDNWLMICYDIIGHISNQAALKYDEGATVHIIEQEVKLDLRSNFTIQLKVQY